MKSVPIFCIQIIRTVLNKPIFYWNSAICIRSLNPVTARMLDTRFLTVPSE